MIKQKALNVAYKLELLHFFSLKFSSISAYVVLINLWMDLAQQIKAADEKDPTIQNLIVMLEQLHEII